MRCLLALVVLGLCLASVIGGKAMAENCGVPRTPPPFIEPIDVGYDAFPDSTATAEGMLTLRADMTARFCQVHLDVVYAEKDGRKLTLQVIEPPKRDGAEGPFPIVMYVQGSAWFEQFIGEKMEMLINFAGRGYVVAIIQYRPSTVAPFPAQIRDAKTAIRFMRKNAAKYNGDPDRMIMWGDSSGGHTTVMTCVTEDDQLFSDESVIQEPLDIKGYVDYYGPVDIARMNSVPSTQNHIVPESPEGMLIGGVNVFENLDLAARTNPVNYIKADKKLRPIFIIHGTKDRLVNFEQSVILYNALKAAGKEATFYRLQGADHAGGAFWTKDVLDIVEGFIKDALARK